MVLILEFSLLLDQRTIVADSFESTCEEA